MENLKHYKCEFYEVDAPADSCLFCKHCEDVFWDYTNGPYAFGCGLTDQGDGCITAHFGHIENCPSFEDDGDGQ